LCEAKGFFDIAVRFAFGEESRGSADAERRQRGERDIFLQQHEMVSIYTSLPS
jgi:hypothetical protein